MDRAGHARAHRGEPALNADHADQLRLLDVQALDARIDQLAHRRRTLPQLAELDRVTGETTQVRDLLVGAQTEQSDIEREVAKSEQDVETVRQRAARDRQRMDAGAVGSAKELEALQHELGSLARRQCDLEEVELEVHAAARGRLGPRRRADACGPARSAAEQADLEAQRDEAFAEIDKDTAYLAASAAGPRPAFPPT